MSNSPYPTHLAVEDLRHIITLEDVRYITGLLSRLRKGRPGVRTAAKAAAGRKNAEIALAVRQGRHEDADRLRWLYYPEKMRKKEIEAQLGKPPKA